MMNNIFMHNPHLNKQYVDDELLEQVLMEGVSKPKQAIFDHFLSSGFISELMKYFPVQNP